jgi:hypothetical protein
LISGASIYPPLTITSLYFRQIDGYFGEKTAARAHLVNREKLLKPYLEYEVTCFPELPAD